MDKHKLFTQQVAYYMGISPAYVRKLVHSKRISPMDMNTKPWYFDMSKIDKFIKSCKRHGV